MDAISKNEHVISIGDCYASSNPIIIRTLLGSCVAVCLFDPHKKIGGMNHILLPGKASPDDFHSPARYAINSTEILINQILTLGGSKMALTAKVFGGANILRTIRAPYATGPKIVHSVREFLELEAIEILQQDTGGSSTRVIYFHTDSGEVTVKRTTASMAKKRALQEKNVLLKLKKEIDRLAEI